MVLREAFTLKGNYYLSYVYFVARVVSLILSVHLFPTWLLNGMSDLLYTSFPNNFHSIITFPLVTISLH